VAFETRPVPPNPDDKPGKILTVEGWVNLDKSRRWLVQQTGIPESKWSDKAVRQIMQITPAPMLWKNRIMIVTPLAELGYSMFWQMLTGTVKHFGWHVDNNLFMTTSGQYIQDAHNSMVKAALEIPGWNYLLFLEHDHVFPSNLLETVAEYTDPVVGALYFNRVYNDPQPVCYYWNPTRTAIGRLQPYQVAPLLEKRGLYEVDVVPMGCTAIRRDVFENWPKDIPWYASPTSAKNGKAMSDDVYFCRHAQEQGYVIKVDSRIIAKHVGLIDVDERMYVAWVKMKRTAGETETVPEKVWEPADGNIPFSLTPVPMNGEAKGNG
jgi:hypothetical protein